MSALDERAIGLASSHTVSFGTDSNSLAGSGCLLANPLTTKKAALVSCHESLNVFHQEVEVKPIGWTLLHSKLEIQASGLFILGVGHKCSDASFFRDTEATLESILEETLANALSLVVLIDSKPCHEENGNRVLGEPLCHAFRSFVVENGADRERVIADDAVPIKAHKGSGAPVGLVG